MQNKEEEIFKEFEKLGYYSIEKIEDRFLYLENNFSVIHIYLEDKQYGKSIDGYDYDLITMEEHKLLTELFKIWGWIE